MDALGLRRLHGPIIDFYRESGFLHLKPFPKNRDEVQHADLLIIQPGIFEEGLKHGFKYPPGYISRTTLYTFEQTMELATHLEAKYPKIRFAYDGMQLRV